MEQRIQKIKGITCHKLQTAESDLYKQNLKCRAFQKGTSLVLESSLADGQMDRQMDRVLGPFIKLFSNISLV